MKALVLAIVATAGCATAPPDAETLEYKRADEQIRAVERFETFTDACRASGGIVYLDRNSGRIPPTPGDMRLARCARQPLRR